MRTSRESGSPGVGQLLTPGDHVVRVIYVHPYKSCVQFAVAEVSMPRVFVQSIQDYNHAQLLTAPHRSFIADEPPEDGGDDLGPTPYQLLLWALGACTAMTIQMYARRKGYPLHEVAIELDHERRYAEDCENCSDPKMRIEQIHRHIVLLGPLSAEQRDDLLRVATRCPVHKTLAAVPRVFDTVEVVD